MSIIQSLWIGDSFSIMEKLCVSSFIKNGDQFHLYTYEDIKGVPDGVVILDANKILSSDKIFKYKEHNSYGGFANLFRYKLLLENGGYWVDMDFVSLKKFNYSQKYIFTKGRISKRRFFRYNYQIFNGLIKAPIGSEIMQYCFDKAMEKDSQELAWGQTGPELLTKAIDLFKMGSFVTKPYVFYPIDWWDWKEFINNYPKKNILKKSDAVHLYNEMWRRNGIDKSGKFPENSIYEILKRRYL